MHTILSIENYDEAIEQTEKAIIADKLVVYPTDTLYGLGCNALSKEAIGKIYSLKSREKRKPLSVIMANKEMIDEYCELSQEQKEMLAKMLPGPYTFVVNLKKKMPATNTEKIGIRVPSHFFMRTVSKRLWLPIVATSANISGEKEALTLEEVSEEVKQKSDLLLDGGKTIYSKPSTVIDLVEKKVLRKGAESPSFPEDKEGNFKW